jgi:hypothetical protein
LNAEEIRIRFSKKFFKTFSQTSAEAIDVPRDQFHFHDIPFLISKIKQILLFLNIYHTTFYENGQGDLQSKSRKHLKYSRFCCIINS